MLGLLGEILIGFLILVLIIVGSLFDIPLGPRNYIVRRRYLFGLVRRPRRVAYLSMNVGGAIIPVCLALFMLPSVAWEKASIATGLVAVIAFFFSGHVIRRGIVIQRFFPSFGVAIIALMFDKQAAFQLAFIAGSFGVLLGADLIRIPWLWLFHRNQPFVIGGAGVRDAILLIPVFAILITLLGDLILW
ncbi:MAG TPA: DUF1614 domain-containing protein [Candidatus Paceibacterota bacterium]